MDSTYPVSTPTDRSRALRDALVQARWLWWPGIMFVVTRLGIAFVAYMAFVILPTSIDPPVYHLRGTENLLLDVFGSRWDSGFYVSIVEEGYQYDAQPFPSVPFFPLLPVLMRLVLPLTGDAVLAGLLVSNLALLGAVIVFYRLVQDEWGAAVADRAVWYLLIFPTSLFGSTIYTESLFLLTAVGALYAARRGYWWPAGVLGILTATTRLVGIIVLPLLFIEWWQRRLDRHAARPAWHTLFATLLPPLGTGAYMFYLWRTFGDPLGFITGSAAWGRVAQSPLATIRHLLEEPVQGWGTALRAGHIHVNDWFDLIIVAVVFGLGLVLLAQQRWSEGVYVWLGVMISFSSGLLMSQRRYVWVLFPLFILLARWGERSWVDRALTALFLLALALFTALFANGYWVA